MNTCRILIRGRYGMTLVEVLVTFAILAVLISLILAGVQNARESARNANCKHRLRGLGQSLAHHTSISDTYGSRYPRSGISIQLELCQLMDLQSHFAGVDLSKRVFLDVLKLSPSEADAIARLQATTISELTCPSDGAASEKIGTAAYSVQPMHVPLGVLNFAANYGDTPYGNERGDGPFSLNRRQPFGPRNVTRGLSNVVGFSEVVIGNGDFDIKRAFIVSQGVIDFDALNSATLLQKCQSNSIGGNSLRYVRGIDPTSFSYDAMKYSHIFNPNSCSCSFENGVASSAASSHPGGVNVVFLDGHVTFVSSAIDPDVWHAIGRVD